MRHSTTDTYKMKREIIHFSKKIASRLSAPERKFHADMTYGIVASQSCLLTRISQRLQEETKKRYTVDRLSDHLAKGLPGEALEAYLEYVRKMAPDEPVIHIDDSDVVKPEGYHFESLGIVRDGSKSTREKNVYCKGYHVTEACVLTGANHPVSIFSEVHSSVEKDFKSTNTITFAAMERGARLFPKATYVMDRGYDDNKMFQKLWGLGQDFVIRLTRKRKLFFHGKWVPAAELCAKRKGKIKLNLFYKALFEKCQNAQTTDLFPPLRVDFPCHTQSMAASNRLDWRKKSLAVGHSAIYQTRPRGRSTRHIFPM